MLLATAGSAARPWRARAVVRTATLALCLLIPLVGFGVWQGVAPSELGAAGLVVVVHIAFWWLLAEVVGRSVPSSSGCLATLVGIWLGVAVLAPAGAKIIVEQAVHLPEGGEILMMQRESVNDAWDLPKPTTMARFIEEHPQWRAYAEVKRPFEWKWYYAFQQVGDQTVARLSAQYIAGRGRRDELTGWLSVLSPPMWVERTLQTLAATDVRSAMAYESAVRAFHAELRAFYYRRLFTEQPFDAKALDFAASVRW